MKQQNREEHARQQADRLLGDESLIREITNLRTRLRVPSEGLATEDAVEVWKEKFVYGVAGAEQQIDDAITAILHEYRLGPGWHHSLKRFLFLNNPHDMQLPTEVQVGIFRDPLTSMPKIHIVLGEGSSFDDVKSAWSRVKAFQKELPYGTGYRRIAYNHEWDKLADELRLQGKGYAEIKDIFDARGYKLDVWAIKDRVYKYRRRSKRRPK